MPPSEVELTVGADPALRNVIVQYVGGGARGRILLTPEQAESAAAALRAAAAYVTAAPQRAFGPCEARATNGIIAARVNAGSLEIDLLVFENVTGVGVRFAAGASDVNTYAEWLELGAREMKKLRDADGRPLQTVLDPFVVQCGGELVASLLDPAAPQPPTQADYVFREQNVITELKSLEENTFGPGFRRKMARLFRSWHERGLLLIYGTPRVDLRRLHPICQREADDVLAAPLQEIIKKANRQISSTKELLGIPQAKGVLWVASDGNTDLQPDDVWFFLSRVLRKKAQDGSAQYRHIDGVIYCNPRMPVEVPGSNAPGLVWLAGARDPSDSELRSFLEVLSESWVRYNETVLIGRPFIRQSALSHPLRFAGVERKLPRINMNDVDVTSKRSKG